MLRRGEPHGGGAVAGVAGVVRQVEHVEQHERRSVAQVDRVLDRRLEVTAEHHHEVGVEDPVHVLRGELEVVRLGARGGQVVHRHPVAPDSLRGLRQRGERGHHVDPAGVFAASISRLAGAARAEARDQGRGHQQAPQGG